MPIRRRAPKGVPVTDELRFPAYNDFGGNCRQAHDNFLLLPEGIRGTQCSDCSSCAIQCPNELKFSPD